MKNIRGGVITSMLLMVCLNIQAAEKSLSLTSPDKRAEVKIALGDKITYSMLYDGKLLIAPSPISIELYDGTIIGSNPKLAKQKSLMVNGEVKPLYGQNAIIKENYNELSLSFKGNYSVIFRAYNEGVAYRFMTSSKEPLKIKNEEATFAFPGNYKGYYRKGKKQDYLYEAVYDYADISKIDSGLVAVLPMLVQIPNGPKLAITESDISDYPGMYVMAEGNTLKGTFRHYPFETNLSKGGPWTVTVTKTSDYIAQTSGNRTFPWRIIIVTNQDRDLINNELVFLLAPEQRNDIDFSWVRTGLIANDWWDLWWDNTPGSTGVQEVILTGVDFKSGTNFDTYKYFIDYAIKNNIEFVNIDFGWCDPHDFGKVHRNLDMPKLLNYSKEKNKKVFLWCIAKTLYRDLEKNMEMFEEWGVAGLKVDFLERDDQLGIQDYHRIAESAAKHRLLIEFHGATNPAGLSRTYPNVLTFEAVYGSEQNNAGNKADPQHNVTMPFVRTIAGPFDYAPGAMDNVSKAHFHVFGGFPLSMGTRAHQVAMFMIYYSPLQFMCDVPTSYVKEPLCLNFISAIPTTWDVTYPLDSKIGEYVTVARKKGDKWFLGSMTNWTARILKINCDFLDKGQYDVAIFKDGVNANLNGNDYKTEHIKVNAGDEIALDMAPGGGWAAVFTPIK